MLQATFLHRQALNLRPDPARVVVRSFKPTTEPRDLNPTDKTRANHIVERVLALDPKVPDQPHSAVVATLLTLLKTKHTIALNIAETRDPVVHYE